MFLPHFLLRAFSRVSPWVLHQAVRLWLVPGFHALRQHRKRLQQGQLFPPFFFLAITDACNLHCQGCWITSQGKPRELSLEDVGRFIQSARQQGNRFFILLGGEPLLYKDLIPLLTKHRDCYFQIITNGLLLTDQIIKQLRRLGNTTILVSLDGFQATNDRRRGPGVFRDVREGLSLLRRSGLIFGIATTITRENVDEVLSAEFTNWVDRQGALYLWYYIYRPVGPNPSPELALDREQLLTVRKRLLDLRRTCPILLIDTYWDAEGRALCPAAAGMGYHIGPAGDIELCPPLSFAVETIRDNDGDLFQTINHSRLLRDFRHFVQQRTRGCIILERPEELIDFLRAHNARDTSGRDAYAEFSRLAPKASHHLPEAEIPESLWTYRWLKNHLFFGLGAYG